MPLLVTVPVVRPVAPVPPLPRGNVPVTPGLGDAANTPAAEVDPRFTSIDGFEVMPVPPLAIGRVPVTPGLGDAANTLAADVDPRFVSIDGFDVIPVPPTDVGNTPDEAPSALRNAAESDTAYILEPSLLTLTDSSLTTSVPSVFSLRH